MKHIFYSIILLPLLLLSPSKIDAQKLGDKGVKISYRNPARKPLPKEFTTYSVLVKGYSEDLKKLEIAPNTYANKQGRIKDFVRVAEGGHLNVEISIGEISNTYGRTVSVDKESKGKDGNIKKWKEYSKVYTVTAPVSYIVRDLNGNILEERIISSKPQEYEHYEGTKDLAWLNKTWKSGGAKLIYDSKKSLLNSNMYNVSKELDYAFSSTVVHSKTNILFIKKHEEEKESLHFAELVQKEFEKMKSDEPIDKIRDAVKPAISYWKELVDKYDASDKKEKKIVHAALINLARVTHYLDMFDSSDSYAKDALEIDFKNGRAETIMNNNKKATELLSKNNMDTRHFRIDNSDAEAPASQFSSGFVDMYVVTAGSSYNSVGGNDFQEQTAEGFIIDDKGKKHEGTFFARNLDKPVFGIHKGLCVRFEYEKNGQLVRSYLDPNKMEQMVFNGENYTLSKVMSSENLLSKKKIFVRDAYKSDKIHIQEAFTYFDEERPKRTDTDSYLLITKGEKRYNTDGTAWVFGFKKKMVEVFGDCGNMETSIRTGTYKYDNRDIIRAAIAYEKACK